MVTARRKAFRALTPFAGQLHPFFLQIAENLSLFESIPRLAAPKDFGTRIPSILHAVCGRNGNGDSLYRL